MITQPNSDLAHPHIEPIQLLSPSECQQVHSSLHSLRSLWQQRQPTIPFYTLGAASYLDVNPQEYRQEYLNKTRSYNQILNAHFGWLYAKLSLALSTYLKAAIAYPPQLALPGFHIYQSCKLFEQPIASVHFDLQYQLLDLVPDCQSPISFTLAIALPQYGGGLNLWNLNYDQAIALGIPLNQVIDQVVAQTPSSFHAYKIGELILHSGHILHQAAAGINLQPKDERITIQGHGVFSQGSWHLYW